MWLNHFNLLAPTLIPLSCKHSRRDIWHSWLMHMVMSESCCRVQHNCCLPSNYQIWIALPLGKHLQSLGFHHETLRKLLPAFAVLHAQTVIGLWKLQIPCTMHNLTRLWNFESSSGSLLWNSMTWTLAVGTLTTCGHTCLWCHVVAPWSEAWTVSTGDQSNIQSSHQVWGSLWSYESLGCRCTLHTWPYHLSNFGAWLWDYRRKKREGLLESLVAMLYHLIELWLHDGVMLNNHAYIFMVVKVFTWVPTRPTLWYMRHFTVPARILLGNRSR